MIISSSEDNSIKLWDLNSSECVKTIQNFKKNAKVSYIFY